MENGRRILLGGAGVFRFNLAAMETDAAEMKSESESALFFGAIVGHFAGPVTIDTMSSAFAAQAVKPFQWPLLIAQIFGNLFLCGLFGTLTGLIAAKVCRPKTIR